MHSGGEIEVGTVRKYKVRIRRLTYLNEIVVNLNLAYSAILRVVFEETDHFVNLRCYCILVDIYFT